jgi:hypothetical protein
MCIEFTAEKTASKVPVIDCLPERLTSFYDGFRKVGLRLRKLATGLELRVFRSGKEFRRFAQTIIFSRLAS